MHRRATAAVLLACAATSAHAGVDRISIGLEHTDYSGGHGQRDIAILETGATFGDTTLMLGAASGRRDYGAEQASSGSRFQATIYQDWHRVLSTRTAITVSTDDPVFVNRSVAHDFNFKVIPNVVLTAGGTYSEYYDSTYLTAWSVGATYYLDRLSATYRYTGYYLSSAGSSRGNLLAIRLKDRLGAGSTQLWLGTGTASHDYEWLPELQDGQFDSVTMRRVQTLTQAVSLDFSLGKMWYQTPAGKYDGLTARIGATYSW